MDGKEKCPSFSIGVPICWTGTILIMCICSKVALYICLPILVVGCIVAAFYVCAICPLKEKNAKDFNYKECVKQSLDYLIYGNFFTNLTTLLIIILFASNFITCIVLIAVILLFVILTIFDNYDFHKYPKNRDNSFIDFDNFENNDIKSKNSMEAAKSEQDRK